MAMTVNAKLTLSANTQVMMFVRGFFCFSASQSYRKKTIRESSKLPNHMRSWNEANSKVRQIKERRNINISIEYGIH